MGDIDNKMKSIDQAKIQSLQAKLKTISKVSNVSFQQLTTLFLLERAVVRLTEDKILYKNLVFKGGYVGLRVYNSPRFTTDIDAVISNITSTDAIERVKKAMALPMDDLVWFQYDSLLALQTQGEYGGIGLKFRGGVGNQPSKLEKSQIISIDLGIGDPVVPSPQNVITNLTLGGHLSWQVYPVETILAEKLHALIKLGDRNSRSKDVFDIALLLPKADVESLRKALEETFNYRGDKLPDQIYGHISQIDTSLLKRGWVSAVASVKNTEGFDHAFNSILNYFSELKM